MAGWLSLDADGSGGDEDRHSHWQADLPIIAKGNELCKTSCPDCGATLFELRCPRCGYEESGAVHRVTGTITAVDENAFTVRAAVEDVEGTLPNGDWIDTEDPGLLERATGQGGPERCTVEFTHDLPVEGLASFASIAQPVEVLAIVEAGRPRAREVNG